MNVIYDNLIIADQNIENRYRGLLEKNRIGVIRIGDEECGCNQNMSDGEIMELGHILGNIPIVTRNGRHFSDYEGIVVRVKETESIHQMLKKTERATKWKMKNMY